MKKKIKLDEVRLLISKQVIASLKSTDMRQIKAGSDPGDSSDPGDGSTDICASSDRLCTNGKCTQISGW